MSLSSSSAFIRPVQLNIPLLLSFRATTSALFSAALTLAAEAKRLDSNAAEEYIDRIQTCFSFFEYIKDHSALAMRVLGELRAFCAEICCHDSEATDKSQFRMDDHVDEARPFVMGG